MTTAGTPVLPASQCQLVEGGRRDEQRLSVAEMFHDRRWSEPERLDCSRKGVNKREGILPAFRRSGAAFMAVDVE